MTAAKTSETPRVQQVAPDNAKLIAQLKALDPNYVRSLLRDAGLVKASNRSASIAHVWGRDSRVLTEIARVLSASYVVSAPKASKKGDSFRVQIMQAK